MKARSSACITGHHQECTISACACSCHPAKPAPVTTPHHHDVLSASNADFELQFEAETGIKKIAGENFYDFNDLQPVADEPTTSVACQEDRHDACKRAGCTCACHHAPAQPEPESTGSAFIAPAPEMTIEQPLVRFIHSQRASLPAGYGIFQQRDGQYVVVHAGEVALKIVGGALVRRTYKHIGSARRYARQAAAKGVK